MSRRSQAIRRKPSAALADLRRRMAHSMSEDDLLKAVIDGAGYMGWRVHHDRRADLALTQGHSGFPDVVLARRGRVLFLELKAELGTVAKDQADWLVHLEPGAGSFELPKESEIASRIAAYVVRPADLDRLLELLT